MENDVFLLFVVFSDLIGQLFYFKGSPRYPLFKWKKMNIYNWSNLKLYWHASQPRRFWSSDFLLALCLFFHSNKSILLDKNKQLFSLRIFCTIQIHLSLSEKINRENLNNLKIWRTWRHTCYFVANFCQIFAKFLPIFFFYVYLY